MRLPLVISGIIIVLSLCSDWYIYRRLKGLHAKWPSAVHIAVCLLLYIWVAVALLLPRRGGTDNQLLGVMWMLFAYCSVYIPKILFVIFDLIASVPELMHRKRLRWLSISGVVLSIALFAALWWGALVNRFNIDVRNVEIEIPGLPAAFDGYKIVQLSDFHVGTYGDDSSYVKEVVDKINSLDKDLVVFTGDLVNARTSEAEPHIKELGAINAPDGVISILGNHDYGDYSAWKDARAKSDNMDRMIEYQKNAGWWLLLNDTQIIRRRGDSIAIVGVENIGDPPFKIYGSLQKAYPALSDNVTKILLTHNPAHWTDSIADHPNRNIALTLSGHTHAMQIEVAGWSPAVFRYPTWGGLYKDKKGTHQLYVNIGIGTVGFPARIGATPEITVITLKKSE